ncbi:MAG TPA: hypothetical protein VFA41_16595 [Ktedonobacteraceae bacterium]|nr:hypothetical protein [Ktedonobacteraceae bacterium]
MIPDNFSIVVPVEEEYLPHTLENPFCPEASCPCHEDADNIAQVAQFVEDGLLTPEEATDFVAGKML